MSFRNWCYEQHAKVNHYYGDYIPYRFHLEMVESVTRRYPNIIRSLTGDRVERVAIIQAVAFAHDILEDTRNTYNNLRQAAERWFNIDDAREIADTVYLLTNNKGKTRDERANGEYYAGIRTSDIAIFVKLCDRIANVEFSKWQASSMFSTYRYENRLFLEQIQTYFWSSMLSKENPNPVTDLNKLFVI